MPVGHSVHIGDVMLTREDMRTNDRLLKALSRIIYKIV